MTAPIAAGSDPLARRRWGVLLHVTSLPSGYGPGDLGPAAERFVDWLAAAGASVWQVLPLVPTHEGDGSPYNGLSAMALSPALISIDRLVADGLLAEADRADVRRGALAAPEARARAATALLRRCAEDDRQREAYDAWRAEHAGWLDDFALFTALREHLGGVPWTAWPEGLRDRQPDAIEEAATVLADRIAEVAAAQYLAARHWSAVHDYAHARGVLVFGDLPIFVSHDSADVWAERDQFLLDADGRPLTVTGVPPDYFAADGQRWNNPHYDWDRMRADGFGWWRRRIAAQRRLFDLVRLDHFRGFEASWHIPADSPTAKEGRWEPSPGREVLAALVEESGPGTLVAEDLGVITPEVEALRREFDLPGMRVLQFAFDGTRDNPHVPARHTPDSIVYTGTHDNDTTRGWYDALDPATRSAVDEALAGPAGEPAQDPTGALIEVALSSPAALAVVPAQDVLGLGSEARMNVPGVATGNWAWQLEGPEFDLAEDQARRRATRLRVVAARNGRV